MEDEKLIEEVFQYQFIYDKSDPKHSNKDYIAKAWGDIAKKLNCSVDEAKKRWVNLRDYFRRQIREQGEKRSGPGAAKKKQWVFFEPMSFLLPYIKGREMTSNCSTMGLQSEEISPPQDDATSVASIDLNEPPAPSPELSQSSSVSCNPSTSAGIVAMNAIAKNSVKSSIKRKAMADDDVAAEIFKAVSEPETADDDDQFFKSCLPMVRQLSLEDKLEFRINVQQLLLQAMRRHRSAEPTEDGYCTLASTIRYHQGYPQ